MSFYDLRTVSLPHALPPKPVAKIKVPLSEAYLAELMAKEAVAVRNRFKSKWGNLSAQASGHDANFTRTQESEARRDALAEKVLDRLSMANSSASDLRAFFKASEHQMKMALRHLKRTGRVENLRSGGEYLWRKMEAAE